MSYLPRWVEAKLGERLSKPYVQIVFGARQTGKSTMLKEMLKDCALTLNMSDPSQRSAYLADPGRLVRECEALPKSKTQLIFIDEAQLVPALFDAVQYLYDANKTRWRFVLCGSSARKLRGAGANLLPGRSLLTHLYPLMLCEHCAAGAAPPSGQSPLPFAWRKPPAKTFPQDDLLTHLAFGELPGIVLAPERTRAELLRSYAAIYLEEEIRREAYVKDWGAFVRFIKFAAIESGQLANFARISRETGISQPTVKSYYQLLEDMFVGFSVPAFSGSKRKGLLSTPKFLFFDIGVRHGAADLQISPAAVELNPGPYFEQWVGIELWKRLGYLGGGELSYLRTKDGLEIDYILRTKNGLVPIEVKWTTKPTLGDARQLISFLDEFNKTAKSAYIVCRCERPQRLDERITAIPWSWL